MRAATQARRRERAPRRRRRRIRNAGIVEPADRTSVEVGLVDRLWRADVAKLWWPVGRDDDHRHVGEPGLDDRWVEVGGRRPARAQQHRRGATQSEPEGDERGRSFVVDHVHRDLWPCGKGQRHRRAARPGCDHPVADAVDDELVDQRRAERRLGARRGHRA